MAITITNTSKELTPVEKYALTTSRDIEVVKNLPDGTKIEVKAWATFEDHKDNGEVVELLSIMDKDNKVYSCQSKTFKSSFEDILACVEGAKSYAIIKRSGTTKAGRPYVDCALDIASVK